MKYSGNNALMDLLQNLPKYFPAGSEAENLARNRNARILGLDSIYMENQTKISEFVGNISKEFDAVVILEYFDESLVVLRRKLCWDLSDILYLPLNVKSYSHKTFSLNSSFIKTLRNWNLVDFKLYETFNETLWKTIAAYPRDFEEEVTFYKAQKRRICTFCEPIVQGLAEGTNENLIIPESPWGKEFKVDYKWCIFSAIRGRVFKNILRIKEHPEICNILHNSTIDFPLREDDYRAMDPMYCDGVRDFREDRYIVPKKLLESIIKRKTLMYDVHCEK